MGEKGLNNLIEAIDLDIKNNEDTINELINDTFEEKDKYSECSDLIIKIIKKEIVTLNLLKEAYKIDDEVIPFEKDALLEHYGHLIKTKKDLLKIKEDLIKIIKGSKMTINMASKDGTIVAKRQILVRRRYCDSFSKYKEKNKALINSLLSLYANIDEVNEEDKSLTDKILCAYETKEEEKKKSLTI